VLVAQLLGERAGGERRAVARGAVDDHLGGAVGDDALDARLEVAACHVLGPGQVADGELLALAHVDDRDALVDQLVDLGGIHLVYLALDLPQKLRPGRAHV